MQGRQSDLACGVPEPGDATRQLRLNGNDLAERFAPLSAVAPQKAARWRRADGAVMPWHRPVAGARQAAGEANEGCDRLKYLFVQPLSRLASSAGAPEELSTRGQRHRWALNHAHPREMKAERILLAFGDAEASTTACAQLEAAGYSVAIARDGAEAIELARENPPALALLEARPPDVCGDALCCSA